MATVFSPDVAVRVAAKKKRTPAANDRQPHNRKKKPKKYTKRKKRGNNSSGERECNVRGPQEWILSVLARNLGVVSHVWAPAPVKCNVEIGDDSTSLRLARR